jgi:AcrR family transcriptional regulator
MDRALDYGSSGWGFDSLPARQRDATAPLARRGVSLLTEAPGPTAPQLHPTAQRVLDAAIESIEVGGEEAIQVEPLVKELGLTVTAIYRWFGNRKGLVQAAQQERFRRLAGVGFDAVAQALTSASDEADVAWVLDRMLEIALSGDQIELRRRRVHSLGSAFGRPELIDSMGALVREQVDLVARPLDDLIARGVLRSGLNGRVLALWYGICILGRVSFDLDPSPPSAQAWNRVCQRAFHLATLGSEPASELSPTAPVPPTTWSEAELPLIPDHPTPQLLVSLTIDLIDAEGEDGVRVEPLTKAAGLNVTTIYHWFGNRQGLIDVAQAVRFRRRSSEHLQAMEQAGRRVASSEDAAALVATTLRLQMDAQTRASQVQRLNALGATYARPTLASAIGTIHHRDRRHLAGILRHFQVGGWVQPDVDLEAMSSWVLGMLLGQSLLVFDGRSELSAGVVDLACETSQRLLFA